MKDYGREIDDALTKSPPPIDPRYYRRYVDMVGRMGVEWFERTVLEWEGDHPVTVPVRRNQRHD